MVADELEFAKPLAAAVAEVGLAAGTGHVIAARAALDVELNNDTAGQFSTAATNSKSKRSMAVSDSPHRYGNSHATWNHTVLPAGRGDIPAVTPAEAGTQLSDPGGMQG